MIFFVFLLKYKTLRPFQSNSEKGFLDNIFRLLLLLLLPEQQRRKFIVAVVVLLFELVF